MRLRKIKLSGFKSFVDPISLIIPENLVGIVGPNGCGKSNIIDAVTWVMGESSAKHLRGESLTDVIFNGSSARQPVSQAMVELTFDNSEGRAGGQYAAYTEISIKRQINREGISVYSLNGTRCRRKDIHGLFLGTGLGPRGYSIIEQGTISRLIEAKPEELRVFIEEAAGVSKYREKRKETENRMGHTRENLARLSDIREELEKQLNRLQRQAKAAERYQVLKLEERKLKAEIMALNYRDLKSDITIREEKVQSQETKVEESLAKLRHIESDIEKKRQDLSTANEFFNQVQSNYYQVGGDISQLEQKIEYSNEKISTLTKDIENINDSISKAEDQYKTDKQTLEDLIEKAITLEPELMGSRSDSNKAYDSLNHAEKAMQKWQDEWDAYKEADADFKQQIEVSNTRVNHLKEGLEEIFYRKESLTKESDVVEKERLGGKLEDLDASLEVKLSEVLDAKKTLESKQNQVVFCRNKMTSVQEKYTESRTQQQKIEGTLAALVSLQKGNAEIDQEKIENWLTNLGVDSRQRLYEEINVEPDWAHALETVLGQHLQSHIVKNFDETINALNSLSGGNISFVSSESQNTPKKDNIHPRLIDKVSYTGSLADNILQQVYIAEDITEALEIYPDLTVSESVVTRTGIWIGRGWVRVNQSSEEDSILLREQKIQLLKSENDNLLSDINTLKVELESVKVELNNAEEHQKNADKQVHELQQGLTTTQSHTAEIRGKNQTAQKRLEQIVEELEVLRDREESSNKEINNIENALERTRNDQTSLSAQKNQLIEIRNKHQDLLDGARNTWQSTHEQSHEIALQLESLSSQKASLEQAIKRTEIQIGNFSGQLKDLQDLQIQVSEPLVEIRKNLEDKIAIRIETEKKLNQSRETVQAVESDIREKDILRSTAEQETEECRLILEQFRLESQEIKVRLQTILEQLKTESHEPEKILAELEEGASKEEWQEKIIKTEQKIHRLGPINLAAIDEHNQLNERKQYLDLQNNDLSEALTTLENAIRKIDKETRTRFKETFDKINDKLKEMFPILFGGGHALLELTGNDLLDTGVAIMARPPGKKNSSIHLLSGGEKAMTAVALVFSIFKLNPAPFCILDEVDAPLDDTNAGRFSELVKQMSAEVQFLVITHNKITMEIAQQLLGVTMHEAGVSRLVTVDIEEAVQLAASA
jgi:chromosome segregation protein